MMNTLRRSQLEAVFQAGLLRVDPFQMIMDHVRLEDGTLCVAFEDLRQEIELDAYQRVVLLGAGKATAPMARAFELILGDRISQGLIVVKYGHTAPLKRVDIVEAGHPEPDENGVRGAAGLMDLAGTADEHTLVISLISGGGSALLPLPLVSERAGSTIALSLADKQAVTRLLLRSGADITEINCVRKHLSGIKGGRLLERIAPARSLNFILSDVVGDDLSSIASGLTTFDPTTFADAFAVLEKYSLLEAVPETVLATLHSGKDQSIQETLKAGHPALSLAGNVLIGTNRLEHIERDPDLFEGVRFLAASTDGNDGPTDAAGAFADLDVLDAADRAGLSIKNYLQNNDSYHFFEAIDGLYTTGPTNTNVCDLHIVLVE